jgi:hypothetical protein
MKKWLADFVWNLIKDRVMVVVQEQAQQQKLEAPRNLNKYAGGNRT